MAMSPLAGGLLNVVAGQGKAAEQRMETASKEDSARRMLEMEMEAKADYEARVHERTRTEQQQDYERNKADQLAAEDRAYQREKGLIGLRKDPNQARLAALQLQQAEAEMKVPKAVSMEYEALKKRNETISSALYKAQADGTYDPASAAKAEADMQANSARMSELLRPFQGDAAPKASGQAGSFDPSKYVVGGAAQDQSAPVKKPVEPMAPTARDVMVRNKFGQIDIAASKAKVIELYGGDPGLKQKLFAELDALKR